VFESNAAACAFAGHLAVAASGGGEPVAASGAASLLLPQAAASLLLPQAAAWEEPAMKDLFGQQLKVVNLGLPAFKDALDAMRVEAVQVEFTPRVAVAPAARAALRDHAEAVAAANEWRSPRARGKPTLIAWDGPST